MYVDDLSNALVFLLKHYSGEQHVNIGTGSDVTIRELAETVARVVGVPGRLRFDASNPDGAPRKLLDSSKMRDLGWSASTGLEDGLKKTYQWFLQNELAAAQ
jgi:GDP-L-fucose synthase